MQYMVAPYGSVAIPSSFWYASGIPAQLVIKILLCNLVLALLRFKDPWCTYGGQYETNITKGAPLGRQASLRLRRLV